MSYTVVSLFPIAVNPENISDKLQENGFTKENINISKYNIDGDIVDEMEEDEKTKNFWDYLFGDTKWRTAYQKAGIDKNTITVYADSLEDARKAKTIMDEEGALDIKKYHKENVDNEYEISQEEEDRIIAKAKHNVYFLEGSRTYRPNSRGMNKRMDSLGAKD